MRGRDFVLILCGVAVVYVPLSFFPAPDLRISLFPWLNQIRVTSLSVPIGNYLPPYLYLLWLFSPLPDLIAVKLLAIIGAGWLAWCVSRLAKALGSDLLTAASLALVLPTVVLNGPVLGQCDSFWTGFCLLAAIEAVEERPYRMALWAGCAFAFKAQAAFLAPFCIGYVIERKAWPALAIPPLVYLLAIVPAALAGWPLEDLLTIYLRQPQYTFIGDAPNLWAIAAALHVRGPTIFPIGYALAAIAAVAIASIRRRDPLLVALLSAILIPFLLPKMLERFFFLADMLSLVIACTHRDRRSIAVAVLVQLGSCLSIIAYLAAWPWLNACASIFSGAALLLVLHQLLHASGEPPSVEPRRVKGYQTLQYE